MRDGAIGVKHVAARAGVSVGTVSNVLNRPDTVSEATRRKVVRAIAELGFVRNESGRQLRAGLSRTIAYVVLDASNPFFTDVARGRRAGRPRRRSRVVPVQQRRRRAPGGGLPRSAARATGAGRADHAGGGGDACSSQVFARRGLPVVLVDRKAGTAWCSVGVDDVEGGELAVTHLCEQGHQRIAFVGGPMRTVQVADRLEGARRAMSAAGRPPESLAVIETAGLNVGEGRRAGERLIGLPRKRRPTAAFCANDLLALGLLQQMTATGVDVPGQLAIVGYDDIEFAGAAAVPLSSVRQPRELLGRTAADLLLAESAAGTEPRAPAGGVPPRARRTDVLDRSANECDGNDPVATTLRQRCSGRQAPHPACAPPTRSAQIVS